MRARSVLRRASVGAAVAAGLAAAAPASAPASPGGLDPSFGSAGITTPFGVPASVAGIARGADGRLVVAGDEGQAGVLVARFTAAGALDRSFAGSGSRVDRFGAGGEPPQRGDVVAVQGDGSVVVAGVAGSTWLLTRYRPDGTPDVLFGAGGVTLRDPSGGAGFPFGGGPLAIAIAASGQIVVAGSSGVINDDGLPGEQITVARYSDRGVPDPAFGRDGFATFQLGRGSRDRHAESMASALALLADGRIVIAGSASDVHGADRAFIARLTSAGGLDGSFAHGGRLLAQLGESSPLRPAQSALAALAVRADGTLLAGGRASDVAGGDAVALARFTPAGSLDAGFGRAGVVVTQLGTATRHSPQSTARTLALAPDGGALIAGTANGGTLAARFDPADGRLSCGYGARGRTLLPAGGGFDPLIAGSPSAVAQPDGALVLTDRLAKGGVLLARLLGGTPATPPARPPRLRSFSVKAAGGARGYAYGYVDAACLPARLRFAVTLASGRTVRTVTQVLHAGSGPQVICARVHGVRAGGHYRIRMSSRESVGSFSERHALHAVAHTTKFAQQGCAG